MTKQTPDRAAVAPSFALLSFASRQSLKVREMPDLERRSQSRKDVVKPVVVQRVDRSLKALGMPIAAVTRDISDDGVGLIFERPTSHDLFAVSFSFDTEEVYLLIEVAWRNSMGPFEYVGGRVLQGLATFPTPESETNY